SAFAAPAFGWLLQKLEAGGPLTTDVFAKGGSVGIAAIIIAAVLALFIRETGWAVHAAKPAK
ncbi:MAG: MFS transporter, partial [Xanthobacteraceae bacterium]